MNQTSAGQCRYCGEEFRVTRAKKQYCSRLCRTKDWRRKRTLIVVRLCAECGEPLNGIHRPNARFCSVKCRYWHSAKLIKRCTHCGQPISGKRPDALYCSGGCRAKHWRAAHQWEVCV